MSAIDVLDRIGKLEAKDREYWMRLSNAEDLLRHHTRVLWIAVLGVALSAVNLLLILVIFIVIALAARS